MPFIIDDLFLRSLGVSIPPFDMIWLLEQIRDHAYRELYNPEEIKDKLKKNRLLYELNELTEEEYKKRCEKLNHDLRMANRVHNMDLNKRLDRLG